jgi:hypothetical protein
MVPYYIGPDLDSSSVSDPYPIHLIRIQHFMLNTDTNPIWIQGFDDQKLKKITADKKILIYFCQKLQFTCP